MKHESFEDMVGRIIAENAELFDYMAQETPLPPKLSQEEADAEALVRRWGAGAGRRMPDGLAEHMLRTNPRASSFTPGMIRLLLAGPPDSGAAQ